MLFLTKNKNLRLIFSKNKYQKFMIRSLFLGLVSSFFLLPAYAAVDVYPGNIVEIDQFVFCCGIKFT